MSIKITGNNLYKSFGENPDEASVFLNEGKSKDRILAQTGQTVGINDVNFTVVEGEIFVVMGLSGSGKSTLRMINGPIKPGAGEILIDGVNVTSSSPDELRQISQGKGGDVFSTGDRKS